MDTIGLDLVQEFYLHLLTDVVKKAAPFLTKHTIEETVTRAIPSGMQEDEDVSVEARVRILKTSKATYYRSLQRTEPDQYSILQQLADCLCPVYPDWLSALDILHRVAATSPDLSLSELLEILAYYVRRECFEQDGDRFRIAGSLVWMNDDISVRRKRLKQYAASVTDGLVGFLKNDPHHEFHVVRLFGTEAEFRDFMQSLQAFTQDWFARNASESAPSGPPFIISFVTSKSRPSPAGSRQEG